MPRIIGDNYNFISNLSPCRSKYSGVIKIYIRKKESKAYIKIVENQI